MSEIGGLVIHDHGFAGDDHRHNTAIGTGLDFGSGYTGQTTFDPTVGVTDQSATEPPYYALCYLMYLGP